MKIHRVTMTGFGPYRETETVDFEEFSDEGLFVITGKTGAGKTSILDAITFALFGDVPRYGNVSDDTVRSKYLRDSAAETRVDLEFSQGNKRYRVSRVPSFTKPGNKNPSQQRAEVTEIKSDGTEVVIAGPKVGQAGKCITEIVRLNSEQFKQVILLAQGAFQEFLLAKSDKRREVLRQLFNSGRYLDYSDKLDQQARELRTKLAHVATEVKTQTENLANELGETVPEHFDGTQESAIVDWVEPLIAQHAVVLAECEAEAMGAEHARAAAEEALNSAKLVAANQKRKARALEAQESLSERAPEVERARLTLKVAQKASSVWLAVEAAFDAELALSDAASLRKSALTNYQSFYPDADVAIETLTLRAKELAAQVLKLTDLAEVEASLVALNDARDVAVKAEADAESHARDLVGNLHELQDDVPVLKAQIAEAMKLADDVVPANQELTAVQTQVTSAREAANFEGALREAREHEIAMLEASDRANATLTSLKKRQFGQFAGVLAQDLVDGEPCLVCGSTTHPRAARFDDDHVSDEEVEIAEAAVEVARSTVLDAKQTVTEAKTKFETASQIAAGYSIDQLESVLVAAQSRVDEAQAAKKQADDLQGRLERLAIQISAASESLTEAKVLLTAAQAKAKQLKDELREKTALVDVASDGFASVAERLVRAEAEHASTEKLHTALVTFDQAQTAHEQAVAKQSKALTEHDFATVAEVKAGRLPKSEQDVLAQTVQSFDEERAVVNSTLAEEALQNLPADTVDLRPLEETYSQAITAKSLADGQLGRVSTVHHNVKNLLASIQGVFADSGSAQQKYETLDRLAQTVRGMGPNTKRMTLETFALAADLEEIVTAANVLLQRMTSGRYELRYSDEIGKHKAQSGLSLEILDAYNEELRPPESLSGGEKFQASLALALGLAEVVTSRNGGVRLDTLFIDEGFGALDEDTLDEVLDTIDALREGGRTVGLISHVEKVKERIHHHINVSVTPGGWSTLAG